MRSAFVREFQYPATRHLPRPVRPLGFKTLLDVRPKRFAIGVEEPVRWPKLEEARAAPMNPAFYMGRVLELEPSGDVLVAAWESPSGRELRAVLPASDFQAEPPSPGEVVRIWTWMELPGAGQQVPRRKVEVKPLDPEEAAERQRRLKEFLEELPERKADET